MSIIDYNTQWMALMLLTLAVICAFPLRMVVGWVPAVTAFWFVATSINACENSKQYELLSPSVAMSFRAYSLDSVAKLFLFLIPMLYWRAPRWMGEAFAWLGVGNAAVILVQAAARGCGGGEDSFCSGFIGNHSMSACFSAIVLPLVVQHMRKLRPLAIATIFAGIFVADASVPVGLLALFLAMYSRKVAPLIILAFGAASWKLGPELLSSGDRFEMWQFFYTEWKHIWVGEGFGAFAAWAYVRQMIVHVKENSWWLWAHNDWLQAFIETGIIGGSLLIATYLRGLWNLWRAREFAEARSLVLLGAMMVFNYPLHLAPVAIFSAWLGVRSQVAHG